MEYGAQRNDMCEDPEAKGNLGNEVSQGREWEG